MKKSLFKNVGTSFFNHLDKNYIHFNCVQFIFLSLLKVHPNQYLNDGVLLK